MQNVQKITAPSSGFPRTIKSWLKSHKIAGGEYLRAVKDLIKPGIEYTFLKGSHLLCTDEHSEEWIVVHSDDVHNLLSSVEVYIQEKPEVEEDEEIEATEETEEIVCTEIDGLYACSLCTKTYKTSKGMINHLLNVHDIHVEEI